MKNRYKTKYLFSKLRKITIMTKTTKYIRLFLTVNLFLTLFTPTIFAKQFTVVIDAGHGGHDSGAIGKYSKEKNLNLTISLLVGGAIERNYPDVKVVYTRKTDVFLTLQERADIVNRNNADVFLCIHTNATGSSAVRGTETFTLRTSGSRAEGNLEVAMRENSVMLLEDDYKTKYQGFDPRSVDSYIMFDFMQDKYLDKSVEIASSIQKEFVKNGRYDRGVQQAGFWVLYKSACPSVLIEIGFISNRSEEEYMNSYDGQREISGAIFNAFVAYKKDYDKKSGKVSNSKNETVIQNENSNAKNIKENSTKNEIINETATKNDTKNSATNGKTDTTKEVDEIVKQPKSEKQTVYKVQIIAMKEKVGSNSSEFKGLTNIERYYENGLYKYTYGDCSTLQEANKLKAKIARKFPHAFVVSFMNGKKIKD